MENLENNNLNLEQVKKIKKVVEERVGYKNPPKHSQFKKGQSGNPAGRRKRIVPKTLQQAFALISNEIVVVKNEKGVPYKCTKGELFIRKTYQDAMQGDKSSRIFILKNFFKTDYDAICKSLLIDPEEERRRYEEEREIKNNILEKLDQMIREEEEQQ